jgi:hypothetical protein
MASCGQPIGIVTTQSALTVRPVDVSTNKAVLVADRTHFFVQMDTFLNTVFKIGCQIPSSMSVGRRNLASSVYASQPLPRRQESFVNSHS